MPSSAGYKRNYKQERVTAKKRKETSNGSASGDATRHRARLAKAKSLGRKLSTNEHVDHKRPLKSGGSNTAKNTRIRTAAANMSAGGKMGNKAGKAAGGRKGKK